MNLNLAISNETQQTAGVAAVVVDEDVERLTEKVAQMEKEVSKWTMGLPVGLPFKAILLQVEMEKEAGVLSASYPMNWRPNTVEAVRSGCDRRSGGAGWKDGVFVIADVEAEAKADDQRRQKEAAEEQARTHKHVAVSRSGLWAEIEDQKNWLPEDVYYGIL